MCYYFSNKWLIAQNCIAYVMWLKINCFSEKVHTRAREDVKTDLT